MYTNDVKIFRYRFKAREGLIVQNGLGWGEIAPLSGFSKESLDEALSETLDCLHYNKSPTLPSVRWGLACASTKYDASPLSIPLCAFKSPFPGSTHLKLKLGALSLQEAIDLATFYSAKYRLRLDFNRSWSLEKALQFANHFSPNSFDYLEEPVAGFENLVRFSNETGFPVAVDESFREEYPVDEISTLSAIIVKPMLTGFIPIFSSATPIVLSSSFESSLGIHLIARKAHPAIPHGLHTFTRDILTSPLIAAEGRLHIPSHTIDTSALCLIHSIP